MSMNRHKRANEGREALSAIIGGPASETDYDPNPTNDLAALDNQVLNRKGGAAGRARWVPLEHIVGDDSLQVRAGGLDQTKAEEYAQRFWDYKGWGDFPAVDLYAQEDTEDLLISDGYHRLEGVKIYNERVDDTLPHELEGRDYITHVLANVRAGGYWAALQNAGLSNLRNGMMLTVEDKAKFLADMLREDNPFSWAGMSHRQIASKLGVSHPTVSNWLKKAQLVSDLPVDTKTVGADGKVRDTSKIRRANKKRAADALEKGRSMTKEERDKRSVINHLRDAAKVLDRMGEKTDAHTLRARADVLVNKWELE